MLIIEGSDCLGKTTFAKKIVRYVLDHSKFPCFYSWMTRPNENNFDFHYDYKMIINPCSVQDRFHLGALAYHNDKLTEPARQDIERWINQQGGIIVVLYASDFNWYEQMIKKDERGNILSLPILCKANKIFTEIVYEQRNSPLPFLTFDISGGKYIDDGLIETIAKAWIDRRYNACQTLKENIK